MHMCAHVSVCRMKGRKRTSETVFHIKKKVKLTWKGTDVDKKISFGERETYLKSKVLRIKIEMEVLNDDFSLHWAVQ